MILRKALEDLCDLAERSGSLEDENAAAVVRIFLGAMFPKEEEEEDHNA